VNRRGTLVPARSLVALLERTHPGHSLTRVFVDDALSSSECLVVTNYALVKASLDLQRAHGLAGPRLLARSIAPALHVEWCTPLDHQGAIVSQKESGDDGRDLVERVDDQVMRRLGIERRL
jgi:hypothetical protein